MDVGGIAGDKLRSFVERIERLQEEIDSINHDKAEVFAEAKSAGFDTKILKIVIKRRRMGEAVDEQDTLVDIYERALAGESEPAPRARAREAA